MPNNKPRQRLRLIGALHRTQIYWQTHSQLSTLISNISGVDINRRRLSRILRYENVRISVEEFAAFDDYLTPLGESLADKPMFEPSGVLAEMARSGGLVCLLASDPIQNLRDLVISHWDVRSMIEVMRAVQEFGRLQLDVDEVVFKSDDEAASIDYHKEAWYRKQEGQLKSVVCIGSPRVARGSEIVLAEMFRVDPFSPQPQDDVDLPFRFFWPKGQHHFPSSFICDETAAAVDDADRTSGSGEMGLRFGARRLSVPLHREWPTSYGIIAAQRRDSGQIRLVVAGLSGFSTLAAARAVQDISTAIPDAPPHKDSPVLWAVVEAKIQAGRKRDGDGPLVRSQRIIEGPNIWSP